VDDAGVRTTTVQLELNYRREGQLRTVNMDQHLKEFLTDWKGSIVRNFGVVASINGRIGFSDPLGFTAMTVSIVFTSAIR
jgi:hypothetical protein